MKEYKIKINGNEYSVTVGNVDDGNASVVVNGAQFDIQVEGMAQRAKPVKIVQPVVVPTGESHPAAVKTNTPSQTASVSAGDLKSPLPGVILDVMVKEGDSVKVGQKLMLLEAMKMENNIDSDRDGVVKSIRVRKGDSVLEGAVLITIG